MLGESAEVPLQELIVHRPYRKDGLTAFDPGGPDGGLDVDLVVELRLGLGAELLEGFPDGNFDGECRSRQVFDVLQNRDGFVRGERLVLSSLPAFSLLETRGEVVRLAELHPHPLGSVAVVDGTLAALEFTDCPPGKAGAIDILRVRHLNPLTLPDTLPGETSRMMHYLMYIVNVGALGG